MTENKDIVCDYQEYLEKSGKSANTIKAYLNDMVSFVTWYEQTIGEEGVEFSPGAVDPREIVDYRGFLL